MARSMKEVHTINYYPINEGAARRAKEMNSFSDYKEGSATAEYFKEKIFCLRTEISRRIQEVRQAEQTTSQSRTSENVPPMKWSKK